MNTLLRRLIRLVPSLANISFGIWRTLDATRAISPRNIWIKLNRKRRRPQWTGLPTWPSSIEPLADASPKSTRKGKWGNVGKCRNEIKMKNANQKGWNFGLTSVHLIIATISSVFSVFFHFSFFSLSLLSFFTSVVSLKERASHWSLIADVRDAQQMRCN